MNNKLKKEINVRKRNKKLSEIDKRKYGVNE